MMKWTIRNTILLIVLIFTTGVGGPLIWATYRYEKLTSEMVSESLMEITQDLFRQHIWRYSDATIKPFIAEWSAASTLVNAMAKKNTEELTILTDIPFNDPKIKNGIIHLRNVVIYDSDLNPVAMSTRGNGESLSEHPASIERLRSQPAGAERQGFEVLWQTSGGRPVLSTFTPIGKFRSLGFIEFVTDPVPALSGIADSVGGTFRLKDRQGNILLTSEPSAISGTSGNAADGTADDDAEPAPDPDSLATLNFVLRGSEGKPWGYATLIRDNTPITEAAGAVSFQIIIAVFLISVAGVVVAWGLLDLTVFSKIRYFVSTIESLAEGDTDVRIPKVAADEFASFRAALKRLRAAVRSRQALQKRSQQEIAERRKIEARLRAAMRDLEHANNTKTEFLAHMSHELRTPLNAIIGFSQMMADEIFGDLGDPKYREYATDVNQASTHLLTVINDILDLSKIEAGEYSFSEETFPVGGAMHETAALLVRQNTDESPRYSLPTVDPAITLLADKRLFKQIVVNLLSNADKFTPENGTIAVTVDRDQESNLLLKVADTGCGIAEEHLQTVLEPFGQARTDSRVAHEGTGLGLPISQRLMALHDGTLTIESAPDAGTTVTLMFPKERVTWGQG